jgi:hypothetical protein
VARWEGWIAGHGQQRLGLGVDAVRAVPADEPSQHVGRPVGEQVGRDHPGENRGPPPRERGQGSEQDPDQADTPELRQRDERLVEGVRAVLDYPALQPGVERDQVGKSCFVDSISCCGLNGFPMNACAPRR